MLNVSSPIFCIPERVLKNAQPNNNPWARAQLLCKRPTPPFLGISNRKWDTTPFVHSRECVAKYFAPTPPKPLACWPAGGLTPLCIYGPICQGNYRTTTHQALDDEAIHQPAKKKLCIFHGMKSMMPKHHCSFRESDEQIP